MPDYHFSFQERKDRRPCGHCWKGLYGYSDGKCPRSDCDMCHGGMCQACNGTGWV